MTYSERSGRAAVVGALSPHAQPYAASLERGDLLELGQLGLQPLEEREREHAPAILRPALDAAGVAVANAIETRRDR